MQTFSGLQSGVVHKPAEELKEKEGKNSHVFAAAIWGTEAHIACIRNKALTHLRVLEEFQLVALLKLV